MSAWDDRRKHHDLLSELEKSNHFFQEVIVIENSRDAVMMSALEALDEGLDYSHITAPLPQISVPVKVMARGIVTDVTDVCNAPVTTEWFYHTNAYYRFAKDVDPMFTQGHPISRPLVPYTPADSLHCDEYPACRASELWLCAFVSALFGIVYYFHPLSSALNLTSLFVS